MKKTLLKGGAIALSAALLLSSAALSGCRKKTASSSGENIVKSEQPQGDRQYDVKLDERTKDTQYQYADDDLSLVDTVSGKKISLGMSRDEIEKITGEATKTDAEYKYYDGVIVAYKDDKAEALVTASGPFDGDTATRYKTSRGIYIGMSMDDFKKAYGDEYSEGTESTNEKGETEKSASRATRYFKKSGSKIEYIGQTLDSDQKTGDTSGIYFQDFMFSKKDNTVATIKIAHWDTMHGR